MFVPTNVTQLSVALVKINKYFGFEIVANSKPVNIKLLSMPLYICNMLLKLKCPTHTK
jgi:hypothetical protein